MTFSKAIWAFVALLPSIALSQTIGYAVNSDDELDADHLLRVNLTTGVVEFVGPLPTAMEDVEGLAFAPDGTLYAVDNATKAVYAVTTDTASALPVGNRQPNLGFSPTANLDFGMTFTCDNQLLLVAEETQSLYAVDIDNGQARVIGESGGLGGPMTAIASYADRTVALSAGGNLYDIDVEAGTSSLIGSIEGYAINDAGLGFDEAGGLWAVLDGTQPETLQFLPGTILRIDPDTAAVLVTAQTRTGIESLAIAPPSGCNLTGTPTPAVVPTLSWYGLLLLILAMPGIAWFGRRQPA